MLMSAVTMGYHLAPSTMGCAMSEFKMVPAGLETMADFIRWAASRFNEAGLCFGHGTDNAIDEAAALVLHTLHLPPDLHAAYFPCRLADSEKEAVLERVRRRVEQRLPLPYITREAWFAGLSFYVDERVLVPRSPIAELIQQGFQPWLDPDSVTDVADVGTGSGCIAIACAHVFPGARVEALDVSDDALAVAAMNVERHGLEEQVRPARSDLLDAVPAGRCFDLIVSNPPYVDAEAMASLPPEYRHEPRGGLAGGDDGLEFARRLLGQAGAHLKDNGVIVVEVGHSAPALEAAFPRVPFTWLEFAQGGTGVFLLTADQVREHFPVSPDTGNG
jgi:ribosomal protein L3 glutamine methyltransferase